MIVRLMLTAALALPLACAAQQPAAQALEQEVLAAERAFADTMKRRDHAAFVSFLAEDAIFYAGERPQRGKAAVAEGWRRFYARPDAPFSWEPEHVEVLPDGSLAYSSGPVRDPSGKVFSRFNSVWRREAPGVWKVVFDKGAPVCDCAAKP